MSGLGDWLACLVCFHLLFICTSTDREKSYLTSLPEGGNIHGINVGFNDAMVKERFLEGSVANDADGYEDIVGLLLARLLLHIGKYPKRYNKFYSQLDNFFLGLGIPGPEETDFAVSKAAAIGYVHSHQGVSLPDCPLAENIRLLRSALGLTDLDTKILLLCVLEKNCYELGLALSELGSVNSERCYSILAAMIGCSQQEVRTALSSRGRLIQTGLMKFDHGSYLVHEKCILYRELGDRLLEPHTSIFSLFSHLFVEYIAGQEGRPTAQDFDYLKEHRDNLLALLQGTMMIDKPGPCNILMYGAAGLGKTSLAFALSQHLGLALYSVAIDEDGKRLGGYARLTAVACASKILSDKRDSLILFDEFESIFSGGIDDFLTSESKQVKPFLNQLLETSTVPTIWISNSTEYSPSFLRRFAYLLEMPTPSQSARRKIAGSYMVGLSEHLVSTVADNKYVTAGLLAATAATVRAGSASGQEIVKDSERFFVSTLNGYLGASNAPLIRTQSTAVKLPFRADCINCDMSLDGIIAGLQVQSEPQCRILLHGSPGTGKSEWARYLARQLDREHLYYRASDILSPYVGETEQNVAKMFRSAESTGGVLLVDEVDTFLASRVSTGQRWHSSVVNEFLTQLETFSGVCVMTTNLIDVLDAAVLRRFNLKLEFKPFSHAQAYTMIQQCAVTLGLNVTGTLLDCLGGLTFGDFAVIVDQHRFNPVRNVENLVERLQTEVNHRAPAKRSVGFLAVA